MLLDLWGLFRRIKAAGFSGNRNDLVLVKEDGKHKRMTLAELEDYLESLQAKEEKRLLRVTRKGKVRPKTVEVIEAPKLILEAARSLVASANDHFEAIARKVQERNDEDELLIILLGI